MGRIIRAVVLLLLLSGVALWWFRARPVSTAPAESSPVAAPAESGPPRPTRPEEVRPEGGPWGRTPPVESPMREQEGVLELIVLGANGPVPEARVSLFLRGAEDPTTHEPAWRLAGGGNTGAQGRLRLPARPGSYLARVTAQGFGAGTLPVRRPAGEAVTQAALTLAAPLSLEGRVVEKESGNGLAGAELQLTLGGSPQQRAEAPAELRHATRADLKGLFRFDQLAPGLYELIATAPSRAARRVANVQVPSTGPLTIDLQGSAYIEGFVLGADGQGESDALVVAAGGEVPRQDTTGPSGSFSLEVTPGVLFLSARKGALVGRLPRPLTLPAGATMKNVKLVLSAPCLLGGVVRRKSDGLPVPGARLDITPHGALGASGHAVAGALGQYAVEAPCGIHDVTVRAHGHSWRSQRGLVLRQGIRAELDFELEALGTLAGRVRRASGEPVAGVKVAFGSRAGAPSEDVVTVLTGVDGGYVLEAVPPGEGVVEARPPGLDAALTQRVKVPGGGVGRADFTVPGELVRLKGRVLEANGDPVAGSVEVSASTSGLVSTSRCAADGTFELSLPAGTWKLVAFEGARESKLVQVTLKPPGPAEVVLKLEVVDQGIPVRVVDADGVPSPKARLVFRGGPKNQIFFGLYTDDEGRGTYNPKLWPPPGERFTAVAYQGLRSGSVETGVKEPSIVVPLAAPACIEGRVRSASSTPVTRFTLQIPYNEWMGMERREFFGEDFVLEEVPAGRWTLKVMTPDGSSGESELEAVPGRCTRVQLELQAGASIRLRLVDAEAGSPLEGWGQLDESAEFRETLGGVVTWHDVAPGKHQVRLGAGLRQRVERDFEVKVGEQLDLGDVALVEGERPGGLGARFAWSPMGVEVSWVLPGGPAQQAGILPGDVMLTCGQVSLLSLADMAPFEQGVPGTPVACQLRRGPRTLQVTLIRAR